MTNFAADQIVEFYHLSSDGWLDVNYRGPIDGGRHMVVLNGRNWNVADEDIREKQSS